jgi:urease accessory protein
MTTATLTTDPSGRRATLRTSTSLLRPMTIACDATSARIALVPEGALLLAGDHVSLSVSVGAGAHLEIVETSGTVAYDMRGGSASWSLEVHVGAGGSLVWQGLPFVASAGSDVRRSTRVTLEEGARLLMRDTLVLGRTGELPGWVHARTDVFQEGPVLVEDLDAAVLNHRVLDTILAIGHEAPGGMTLESGGRLWRALSDEAHSTGLNGVWRSFTVEPGVLGP